MALIDSISSVGVNPALAGLSKTLGNNEESRGGDVAGAGDGFLSMFNNLLSDTNKAQNVASTSIAQLAAGDNVELHQVMLNLQEAKLMMDLTLQVRNKVIEAYQEITRMPI